MLGLHISARQQDRYVRPTDSLESVGYQSQQNGSDIQMTIRDQFHAAEGHLKYQRYDRGNERNS